MLALTNPINGGIVENWDDTEALWAQAYSQLNAAPEEHNIMLTAPYHTMENRERMVQVRQLYTILDTVPKTI